MSGQSTITLYDVHSSLEERTISQYVCMTRLLLNYKKIPYKTVWIEFPDIEPISKSVGALPTSKKAADGSPYYTIPFITVAPPEGSSDPVIAVSGSSNIASYIEKTFNVDPKLQLIPDETRVFHAVFRQYLNEKVFWAYIGLAVQSFINKLSTPEWYAESREKHIGIALKEMIPKDEAAAHENLQKTLDGLTTILSEGGEGNFQLMNGRVSYADFELLGHLNFIRRVIPETWRRVKDRNGGRWQKLVELHTDILPAPVV